MKTLKSLFPLFFMLVFIASCEMDTFMADPELSENTIDLTNSNQALKSSKANSSKATGSVEFLFKGGEKGNESGNQPEDLRAFFEFDAHQGSATIGSKGKIIYRVTKIDLSLHREIIADIQYVFVDADQKKAWFIGMVVSDSKGCGGSPDEGHESGCTDDHTDGESCGDIGHDSGCSHDDTGTTGDEGCSGSETEHDATGMEGKGNPLSGKNCRIGQLIAVKVHDLATPGAKGDGLTWKWFDPNADFVPTISNISAWPHLCKKTIIDGNLVVHK